ncbi:MAG TPA: VOC family protein [Vicinamibacterales bacterium]|nr:VOC family protein [Vicinamibacterales bacterium]
MTLRLLLAVALGAALWQTPPAVPSRPRVFGIAQVSFQTSDLAKARAFYGGVLGFAEEPSGAPGRAVFVVNARQRLIIADGLPPDRDERLLNIAFDVDARPPDTADPDGHPVRFVSTSGSADASASPDRRISRRILHAGLTIKDPAAADRFYKDRLGFSEIWRGGRPEGTISWINMRVPDGTDYIEYMLYPGAPPTRQQLGSAHHIALLVPDIQQALETVRARTTPDDRNHRAVPNIGVNNRWQLNVFDPDGTRTEFMEPWTVR